jgi:hypothetical protein
MKKRIGLGLLLAAFVVPGLMAGGNQAKQPAGLAPLRLGHLNSTAQLLAFASQEAGFFKEEDLNAELAQFAGAAELAARDGAVSFADIRTSLAIAISLGLFNDIQAENQLSGRHDNAGLVFVRTGGFKGNSYFTGEDTLEAVRESGAAKLNIVVSDLYGIETAEACRNRFGIPFVSGSLPIGPTASAKLLRSVVEALKLDVDVDAVIERENRKFYRFLEPLVDLYFDADLQRYAVIVADINYAVGLTQRRRGGQAPADPLSQAGNGSLRGHPDPGFCDRQLPGTGPGAKDRRSRTFRSAFRWRTALC